MEVKTEQTIEPHPEIVKHEQAGDLCHSASWALDVGIDQEIYD